MKARRSPRNSLGTLATDSMGAIEAGQPILSAIVAAYDELTAIGFPPTATAANGHTDRRIFVVGHTACGAAFGVGGRDRTLAVARFGEVGHVLVPDVRRERIDGEFVQLVEIDGCLAVDAGVGGPEQDFAGVRVDQPSVFVVGLV